MREPGSVDYFNRLELELRAAAERAPRRRPRWTPAARTVAAVAIASAVVALVLVPVVVFLGSGSGDEPERVTVHTPPGPLPVGSVIRRYGREHTVVATGTAPVAGPWQLEAYGRLPCLAILQLDPPPGDPTDLSGGCDESRRTPGFGRRQSSVPPTKTPREIVVYGRAPEQASAVVLTLGGKVRKRVEPFEGPPSVSGDFYVIAIPPQLKNGRVNWIDRDGREGSRGIALLPR
jgi:hypothetical protein